MKKQILISMLLVAVLIRINLAQTSICFSADSFKTRSESTQPKKINAALNLKESKTAFNEQGFKVMLFPNPAITLINIYSTVKNGNAKLYWLTGEMAKEVSFENGNAQMPVNDLPKGVYLMNVISGSKNITTKVIIK